MASIFPSVGNGGVEVRDEAGIPIPVSNVPNAFVPPADFAVSCSLTYLPNDCYARISPDQINAIQSEMLCLAVTMDPGGAWDCSSLCNLSTAFQNFVSNFQGQEIGSAICGIPTGAGTEATARLVYCVGGVARGLPITGEESLLDLFLGSLCDLAEGDPNNPGSRFIFCDGSGQLLTADALAFQYYRGPYVEAYSYTPSQMVQRGDRLWTPNTAIPAGTPFAIGLTGATWREISSSPIAPWELARAYSKDSIASRNGMLYAANDAIPAGTPFEVGTTGSTWRLVNLSEAHVLEFDPTKVYTRFTVVTRTGLIYRATASEIPAGSWDATQWELIGGEKNIYRGIHDTAKPYLQNDTVEVSGFLFAANSDIPANTAFLEGESGITWRPLGRGTRRVEIALSVTQGWTADELVAVYVTTAPFTLPKFLPDSKASAIATAPLTSSLKILKNGDLVGALTIYEGTPTFSFEDAVSFDAGDTLAFRSETTSAFDYVALTLAGTR